MLFSCLYKQLPNLVNLKINVLCSCQIFSIPPTLKMVDPIYAHKFFYEPQFSTSK